MKFLLRAGGSCKGFIYNNIKISNNPWSVSIGSTSDRKTKAKNSNLLHIINYCALLPNCELKFLIQISSCISEHV